MSKIPGHIIDEIMSTARIEEVIGEFVQLKRSGSNLKGLSPFTNEKTPSFMVSPAKQIFKCFSTGKGGTSVSFLMEKEHFSYPEALKWLANKYNIAIPVQEDLTAEQLALAGEKETLHIINEFAKNHFIQSMFETDEGKSIGLSYFKHRGFSAEIIAQFQLGYCLNTGNDLTEQALAKGHKFEYLEKVGLSKEKEGRRFDFFKGRVIFPIHSPSGRVLGFGGRTLLNDKKVAKYFNSPESPVYNKSEILYGLYFAKGEIIKKDLCLLCEGYTDVISMHQAGLVNAVSSSGTSLTKEQIRLVSRYTKNITILYDGDSAGIKASFRGIDLILEEGLNVKVLLFPDGEDPDSYSKKTPLDEFNAFIEGNSQDFIGFKAGILLHEAGEDPIVKSQVIRELIYSISLIPDSITRSVYTKQVSAKFELSESMLSNEIAKLRSKKFFSDNTAQLDTNHPLESEQPNLDTVPSFEESIKVGEDPRNQVVELEMIRLLLKYGDRELALSDTEENSTVTQFLINDLLQDELSFRHPMCQQIFNTMVDGVRNGIIYTGNYFVRQEEAELVSFCVNLIGVEDELSPQWENKYHISTKHEDSNLPITISHALFSFKQSKIAEQIAAIQVKLNQPDCPPEEQIMLLAEQMAYEKIKKDIASRIGRIILR